MDYRYPKFELEGSIILRLTLCTKDVGLEICDSFLVSSMTWPERFKSGTGEYINGSHAWLEIVGKAARIEDVYCV